MSWIDQRISEFIGRTLTCQSDMLNAFLGALRQAWTLTDLTYHFWSLSFVLAREGHVLTEGEVLAALFWLPVKYLD